VPTDFIRCLRLDSLRRSPRTTLLPPGRVRPELSRCITSCTACDFPVHQFGHGVTALHVVALLVNALHSSSPFLRCRTRSSLRLYRIAGPSAAALAKLPPCAALLPSARVGPEPPRLSSIHAFPRCQCHAPPHLRARRSVAPTPASASIPALPRVCAEPNHLCLCRPALHPALASAGATPGWCLFSHARASSSPPPVFCSAQASSAPVPAAVPASA
jgi:hypothetical protein